MRTPAPLTASDRVYQSIRQMVISGEMPPGTRLVQRQLAKQLDSSSIPVLEALRRLEHDGLVESHANWGAQVRQWSYEDIEGAYLAREALEGMAARLFVERATQVDRAHLLELARFLEDQVTAGDTGAIAAADVDFHLHIVQATKSQTLYRLVESSCIITSCIRYSMSGSFRVPAAGMHLKLAKVVTGKSPAAAEDATREHVRTGLAQVLKANLTNCPKAPSPSSQRS